MIQTRAAILGFRQDRVGARLVGLLNVMRLGQVLGVPARFVWLAQPGGPYPDLVQPEALLSRAFVRRHMIVTDSAPDLRTRCDLSAEAPRMDRATLAAAIAGGARFQSDAAFHAIRLMGETKAEVAAQIAALARDLPLAQPLARALAEARSQIAALGEEAGAVHVRRGDLLHQEPWCLTGWPAKYVPDEMVAAFAAHHPGPVIAFSDTPAAMAGISAMIVGQGGRALIPVGDLIGAPDLTTAQRDVLELLLLSGLSVIGAPVASAFSAAAQLIGQAKVVTLPRKLPRDLRVRAEDALLDRLMTRPESFLGPGDRAQAAGFVIERAAACSQAGRLARTLADDTPLLAAHPFVRLLAARAWMAAGETGLAQKMVAAALADPRTQRRDRLRLHDLNMTLAVQDGGAEVEATFVSALFLPAAMGGTALPALMARVMDLSDSRARAALMLPPSPDPMPPLWLCRLDWSEFLRGAAADALMARPTLGGKTKDVRQACPNIDIWLADPEAPLVPPEACARWWLGAQAAILALHGRYRRALAILHAMAAAAPEEALTQKRLANTCFHIGNTEAGLRHLDAALALRPDHVLLNLSRAVRAKDGQALARAQAAWPDLTLITRLGRAIP